MGIIIDVLHLAGKYKASYLLLFSVLTIFNSIGQGIIIADDRKQQELFTPSQEADIINFANKISLQYKEVILHLGRSKVFEDGNIFTSNISRHNLLLFCRQIKKNHSNIYLWFFDSYGDKNFNMLYDEYSAIIDDNLHLLEILNIPYDGVVVDMEWINHGGGDNNTKYIQILRYLRSQLPQKKIYCFASLINDTHENKERGYNINEILSYADNIIEMLYPQDANFFLLSPHKKPVLNIERINNLRTYYKKQHWLVAISLEGAMLMQNEQKDGFTLIPELKGGYKPLIDISKFKHRTNNSLSTIYEYKIRSPQVFTTTDGTQLLWRKKQRFFKIKFKQRKLVTAKDFIWEYFLLNNE